ncbi:uncharacterized protein PGTG_11205 [Puccinia graminis f. sp. tritici CRL 75-36-700-3]|uniref:Uncharacterized protein n=1 Tax=Puccinia graminis f. sp. tritici (strain CRL 75-36-700-3 / race SCCL) TaxID=418459 RepID=E3KL61_PUCGT|nr:uncharacterized protein PGTG_11205 [Puccinia graminis f. sp. tritici CRL 75-36-700-3]EFP85036.2 hypothetical protein PGTG_11205 [Puccinia graminis f. sp. tritici CRL 75-36-700-3]
MEADITVDDCKEPLEQLVWLCQHLGSKSKVPGWVEHSKYLQNFIKTVRISKLSSLDHVAHQKESIQLNQRRMLKNTRILTIYKAKEEGRQELLATLRAMEPAAKAAFLATEA